MFTALGQLQPLLNKILNLIEKLMTALPPNKNKTNHGCHLQMNDKVRTHLQLVKVWNLTLQIQKKFLLPRHLPKILSTKQIENIFRLKKK
jgi:hypothetical protein